MYDMEYEVKQSFKQYDEYKKTRLSDRLYTKEPSIKSYTGENESMVVYLSYIRGNSWWDLSVHKKTYISDEDGYQNTMRIDGAHYESITSAVKEFKKLVEKYNLIVK